MKRFEKPILVTRGRICRRLDFTMGACPHIVHQLYQWTVSKGSAPLVFNVGGTKTYSTISGLQSVNQ